MNDSTALVTGANKGIGKEIARQLAAAGIIVYVGSRDPERGQRTVDEIGGNARLLVLDVTDPYSVIFAAPRPGTARAGPLTAAARAVTPADTSGAGG